ncbi:MAG TPA: nuclear transport factor 2 family protein [Candidatus Saccharimonadales bacterium]|nr:nuclear transport factor 2 family protein [Candidatus Saccharimonadales bacterium]
MRHLILLLLLAAGLQTSIAQNTPPHRAAQSHPRGVEMEVRDADLRFARETAARGLDGWMDSFADDATVIAAGRTVEGKQAIREFFSAVFADKTYSLTWTPTRVETSADGTLGYTYGNYEAHYGSTVRHGLYVTVWRKVGGQWKVALDLGSPLP